MNLDRIRERLRLGMQAARHRMAHPEALWDLAVLGCLTGLAAGGVILLFRWAVEGSQAGMLPGGLEENFEALAPWQRLLLPILGGFVIGMLFHGLARGDYVVGVTKLLERMLYHQGRIGWRGFVLQFTGSALAIISGHSVGREGPHVYLGAASGSLLGQRLRLPHNAVRTLAASGAAAGIAASFNTPLAGVIFSLEVVMMEYTVASFIPVMLAAVAATALSNAVFGSQPAFEVALQMGSLAEMPVVLALGLAVGVLSALFNQTVTFTARHTQGLIFWQRTTLAGVLVGVVAMGVPEVMGIGYDTVNAVLNGELLFSALLLILLAKVVASAGCVALGVPGGVIGPMLFMGAMLGGIAGIVGDTLLDGVESYPAFYALLGMGAMMGASLQAPLAALTAMMELTHNPGIIMPGMLAIVSASLVSKQVFGQESLFLAVLKANGMDYDASPAAQAMRRISVISKMNRRFACAPATVSPADGALLLEEEPDWLVLNDENGPASLMEPDDLARYLKEHGDEGEQIDLQEIPARRHQLAVVSARATLQEALERLQAEGAHAVVVRSSEADTPCIQGILTRGRIESAYRM